VRRAGDGAHLEMRIGAIGGGNGGGEAEHPAFEKDDVDGTCRASDGSRDGGRARERTSCHGPSLSGSSISPAAVLRLVVSRESDGSRAVSNR
jgi:hypothetical protein